MAIPIIIPVVAGGVLIGAAIAYYFTSNNASKNKEKYMRDVNATLEMLKKKAEEIIKKYNELKDQHIKTQSENSDLKTQLTNLTDQLNKTNREIESLKEELKRWQNAPVERGGWSTVINMPAWSKILYSSVILRQNKFNPDSTLEYLKNRRIDIDKEIKLIKAIKLNLDAILMAKR